MPFSPTPHSSGGPSAGHGGSSGLFYRHEKHSPSPPAAQPAMNKRDKRRILIQDRLANIVQTFADNRDANYRKQLQQYHADITFINNAQLYDDRPLLEPGEEDEEEIGSKGTRQQQPNISNGSTRAEAQPKTGKHAVRFVQEVNDAMEERDVNLTATVYNFNFAIRQYEKDYQFAIDIAEIEHQRLLRSLRQQLIASVQQKKVGLIREKEKLDIADTNALLHYPNQFSINSTASPGGAQSNRKTRHTRHRLDVDDLDTAINNSTSNGKRKRRAAAEPETGSPGPIPTREAEPAHTNGYKDLQTRVDAPATPTRVYTLSRLFTDRELNANLQQSTYEAIASRTTASTNGTTTTTANGTSNKRHKPNPTSHANNNITDSLLPPHHHLADPATDHEDALSTTGPPAARNASPPHLDLPSPPPAAAAVSMDRTPSQLYHATRSAGKLGLSSSSSAHNTDPRQILGELAGRQAGADLIGSIGGGTGRGGGEKLKKQDGDEYQRAPPLSESDAAEDLRLIERAMRRAEEEEREGDEEEGGRGGVEDDEGANGNGNGNGGVGREAGIERRILELAVGGEMRDWVGPDGFGTG